MKRTKEDALKTKSLIMQTAIDLLARDGVEATTLEKIAREAGCTRGAVYWHFKNKQELINTIISDYKTEEASALYRLAASTSSGLELLKKYATYTMTKLHNNDSGAKVDKILYNNVQSLMKVGIEYNIDDDIKFFEDLFEKARTDGEMKTKLPSKDLSFMYLSYLYGMGLLLYSTVDLSYENRYESYIENFFSTL